MDESEEEEEEELDPDKYKFTPESDVSDDEGKIHLFASFFCVGFVLNFFSCNYYSSNSN